MQLAAFGLNHHTAPVHLREQVVFHVERMHMALKEFIDRRFAREAAILSTCNRTEIYCASEHGVEVVADAARWLADFHRVDPGILKHICTLSVMSRQCGTRFVSPQAWIRW